MHAPKLRFEWPGNFRHPALVDRYRVVSLSDPLFSSLVYNEENPDASGVTSLRILPDGSITPSTYLVSPQWRKANIENVYLNDEKLSQTLLDIAGTNIPGKCHDCELNNMCKGGAVDRRIIWYNTLGEPDPYCPFRYGEKIREWKREKKNTMQGPSIHDGYLPTLIFSP